MTLRMKDDGLYAFLLSVIVVAAIFTFGTWIESWHEDIPEVSVGNGLEPSTKEMKCVLFSSTVIATVDGKVIAIPHREAEKAALEAMRRWKEAHPKASIITTFPVGTPPTQYYVIYVEQE